MEVLNTNNRKKKIHYNKTVILHQEQEVSNNTDKKVKSLKVWDIQRSCVHDGPGIRTTIFFQGCALNCLWCQNPEGKSISTEANNKFSVSNIVNIVLKDKDYFTKTDGGVTLSGGDPLLQDPDSLITLIKVLKKHDIHIAVETALHVPSKNIEKLAPYIDLFLLDLKIVGNERFHKKYTKQNTTLINKNIKILLNLKANIQFRMVIIPNINDMNSTIKATANFLKSINYNSIELLKYHNMYEKKASDLGIEQKHLNITPEESLKALLKSVKQFKLFGISALNENLNPSPKKAIFTNRVYKIQNTIRESDYHLCIESSKLKTQYYKKNGFNKATTIHRAERLAYVLKNKSINIYPDELLVGNFTSKRVGGQVWEEHYGIMLASIMHQIDKQKPIPFKISKKDKLTFYTEIFPFWFKHSLIRKATPGIKDLITMLSRASDLSAGFNNNLAAIVHFVVNHERILKLGTIGIIKEIENEMKTNKDKKDFYKAAIISLKALGNFAERYSDELYEKALNETNPERKQELEKMAKICKFVPKNPARTFYEALQSMMFLQIALSMESFENAVSFGRIDQILYPYYLKDKENGIITYKKAKELLALFVLKMDEAILVNDGDTYLSLGRLFETQSTDQSLTFGGIDKNGNNATNEISYMLLDICELQPLAVNMTARINQNSPKKFTDRIAEVYINGAPMPALYNDDIYIKTLQKHYPQTSIKDSRNYAIVGCVEPNASNDHFGNTDCANVNLALPFLQALKGQNDDLWNIGLLADIEKITNKAIEYNLGKLNNKFSKSILNKYSNWRSNKKIPTLLLNKFNLKRKANISYNYPKNMNELLERFQNRLNNLTNSILKDHQKIEKELKKGFHTPLTSSLYENCVKTGKDVIEGGAKINSSGIQGVGVTDVGDSLNAINEVVFNKKLYTIEEIVKAIDNNFKGEFNQAIRKELLKVPKLGDDISDNPKKWVNKTMEIFTNSLKSVKNSPRNGIYTAGYYALNVNIIYGLRTPALPSGRLKGTPLANSVAPHYGKEVLDLMSSLNSVASLDFTNYAPNGTTVTFTIDSGLFQNENGVSNLSGLITTYFKKGGMQFQPNVINRDILVDAYNNPEKHKYLMVRVAGYCSYFNNISDELKLAIINRSCYL